VRIQIVSGAEVAVDSQPAAWLDLGLGYASVDAGFRGGVIDLGVPRQLLSAGAGIKVQACGLSRCGRNLRDQHYVTRAGYSPTFRPTGPPDSILFGDPANWRRFGASVTYHFAPGDR
jgi:hypothetical protein